MGCAKTGISHLKSFLQMALTSAYAQPGVEQDLWSTFWFYNVQSACLLDRELAKQARTHQRQYSYRINRNGFTQGPLPLASQRPDQKVATHPVPGRRAALARPHQSATGRARPPPGTL